MTQFKNDLAFILRTVHCGYRVSFGNSFRGGIFCELVGRNIVIKQSRRRRVTTLWSSHQSQAIITMLLLLKVKKFKTARFAAWIGGLDIKEELEKANVEFRTESWLPQVIMVTSIMVPLVLILRAKLTPQCR